MVDKNPNLVSIRWKYLATGLLGCLITSDCNHRQTKEKLAQTERALAGARATNGTTWSLITPQPVSTTHKTWPQAVYDYVPRKYLPDQ